MKLSKESCELVRNWIYRNARPLDLARWKFHFENGNREDVLLALSAYQNKDDGFGHGLEADCWNPNSSPIQTWYATEILYELGMSDKMNPIVQGILSFLGNCKDYRDDFWYAEIPSNNDYPHAPWWSYDESTIAEWGYNPTICLVGFILYFADKQSPLYEKAMQIAKKAVNELLKGSTKDMHEIICFIRFMEYCGKAELKDLFDTNKMRRLLTEQVNSAINRNKKEWETCYVCKPSQFMYSKDSIFYTDNSDIAQYEADFIINSLRSDGSWNINWSWDSFPEEWAVSKNWWKADQSIKNMRYLKGFGCL